MATIIRGESQKPNAVNQLISCIRTNETSDEVLYVGFPNVKLADGSKFVDAVLISGRYGLIAFDLQEGSAPSDHKKNQDSLFNAFHAQLSLHSELMDGRDLLVPVIPVTFLTSTSEMVQENTSTKEYPVCNKHSLNTWLSKQNWDKGELFSELQGIVQSVKTIRRPASIRRTDKPNSLGSILGDLEKKISHLDKNQTRAVLETVEGVQRIRGLAGSGKSIALARKAAYLHGQYPDWTIGITFNSRSLKPFYQKLITDFFVASYDQEPDWRKIQVLNAWGARLSNKDTGIYRVFCEENEVEFMNFASAASRARSGENAFNYACQQAIQEASSNNAEVFKAILVDEAQDLPPAFLQICYRLLDSKKRLVYAYDELQNLGMESLPPPENIFGQRGDGTPIVKLVANQPGEKHQDIILSRCYRNSRPVLVTAHALGFGIYRKPMPDEGTGIIQMFDDEKLWHEIGYRNEHSSSIAKGSQVSLTRSDEMSPTFLEDHSDDDDLIIFKVFETIEEQAEWVAQSIDANLTKDELRHSDILVINPKPSTTRQNSSIIRAKLLERGIRNHLAGDIDANVFFEDESITFSGIYRAKGNEAGMVYVINADECFWPISQSQAVLRNRLFTAITRSKAWVRVVGIGDEMRGLEKEFRKVVTENYKLSFKYPTSDQLSRLKLIARQEVAPSDSMPEMTEAFKDMLISKLVLNSEQIHQLEAIKAKRTIGK